MGTILVYYYFQNQADVERVDQFLSQVADHLKTSSETNEPDPEWLAGTEADKHEKVKDLSLCT